MDKIVGAVGCFGIILIVLLCLAIEPFCIMLLWNWIAAGLFGAPVITFWQAFGIGWLCNLLFGGVHYTVKSN